MSHVYAGSLINSVQMINLGHLRGDPMLTIMFILVVGGGMLGFGVFVTVLICGIWGGFETDPSFPHSKVERGLHSSIDER